MSEQNKWARLEKTYGKQILIGAPKDDILSAIVKSTTKKEMNTLRAAIVELRDPYVIQVWQTSFRSICEAR